MLRNKNICSVNFLHTQTAILDFDEICRLCAFDRVRIPINHAFCEISANRQGSIPCKTGGTFFEEYVWRSEMLLLTLLVALNKKFWVGKFSSEVFRPPKNRPILGFDEICRLCAFDRVRIPINRAFCEISLVGVLILGVSTSYLVWRKYWRSLSPHQI